MPSLTSDYLRGLQFSAQQLASIQRLGQARGRQQLFIQQVPQQLESLRRSAIIESTESSNRIEGAPRAPSAEIGGLDCS